MRLEGRVSRDGRFWLSEVPVLDAVTQGRSRREALDMLRDLIETMADTRGFEVRVHALGSGQLEIDSDRPEVLLALLLRRQREQRGLTLGDLAERLGQRSRNAYARYEQGRAIPTVIKLEQLLQAIDPTQSIVLSLRPDGTGHSSTTARTRSAAAASRGRSSAR